MVSEGREKCHRDKSLHPTTNLAYQFRSFKSIKVPLQFAVALAALSSLQVLQFQFMLQRFREGSEQKAVIIILTG